MVFYSREEHASEKNGTIIVDKFLWYTSIIVNGCLEAGTYLVGMWKGALKRLPKGYEPKNILLLGLGGGNIIRLLQERYPEVKITVIEWDDVMIKIAKELKLFSLTPNIKISNRDAYEALENMSEKFDVIIVDLFTGPIPPEFLGKIETVSNLKKVLKQDGYIFLNVYKHVHYIETFKQQLHVEKIWKYKLNTLALFRQSNEVPSDFVDMRQSENYLKGLFKFGEIIKTNMLGVRHSKGPFAVEYYTGDVAPELLSFRGVRFVIWDRVRNDVVPKGWYKMMPGSSLGTSVVSDISSDDYWKTWSETARRYRLKWETQQEYEIIAIDIDTFTSYYLQFGKPTETRQTILKALKNRIHVNKDAIKLFALQEKTTKNIVAGMSIVDAKEISHSYYLSAFLNKENAPAQSGLWLINNWFLHCRNHGIKFANFGPVWTKGQPKSWKGFTEFKAHFRPFALTYKRPLFKFTFQMRDR